MSKKAGNATPNRSQSTIIYQLYPCVVEIRIFDAKISHKSHWESQRKRDIQKSQRNPIISHSDILPFTEPPTHHCGHSAY